MAEKKVEKTKVQSDHLSDSDTPDEEVDPQLWYVRGRKNLWDDKRIHTGYTGSVIAYKSTEQSNSGKRPTEVTQNKETLQRTGQLKKLSRQKTRKSQCDRQ